MSYDEHQAMWPQMIAALAAIDEALGLPQDGCNSTAQTLAKIRNLRSAEDKCNSYIVDNARLAEELQRLRLLTFCGCGDQFTAHDPGTCGACVAGMTCAPGWNPGA